MGSKRKRQAQEASHLAPAAKKQQKDSKAPSVDTVTVPSPIVHAPFLDDPKGPHLKREVQLYDQLSSEDESERIAAAGAVIAGLLGGDGVPETTLLRHLERRLFRGLASGRKAARLGFSIVITEILEQLYSTKRLTEGQYKNLTFDRVLDTLSAKTKPEGDLSGQEERDHYLGLLFGLHCFVRARVLFNDASDGWNKILDMLLQLAQKKPWIREECGSVVVEALVQMGQSQAESQSHAENTLKKVQTAGLAAGPEGVGIWLVAKRIFPDLTFPSKPWGMSGNPLEHLKTLAKALKESSTPDADGQPQAKQTGNWNPQLHFVWNLVLNQYIEDAKSGNDDFELKFKNFWKVAVDENLFSDNASRERKFWGFLIFQKMLRDTASQPALLSNIFSPNLVRCLINHSSNKDRFLHRAAEKSLKVLQQVAGEVPESIVTILPKLIGEHGNYNFDGITKTKTIEALLSQVDSNTAADIIKALLAPAVRPKSDDEKAVDLRRQLFSDYLLFLVRHVSPSDDSNSSGYVEGIILPTLAEFAYTKKHHCKPELSEKTRTLFKNRLTSAFAHLISDAKGFAYPCKLLKAFTPDAVSMDAGISATRDQAMSKVEKLMKMAKKADEGEKRPPQALALLYSLTIFQLLNGEPDSVGVFDDLQLCYDQLKKNTAEDDVDTSVVLIEVLLSLISKPSKLLRKASQHVFTAFSDDVSEEGLSLMTDVLKTSEGLKGQQELFDQDNADIEEDGDEDEDEADDSELDSDVEVVETNGDDEEEEEDSDDEEDGDDDADDADEDSEEAKKLDEALAKALGTHLTEDDASDSDADMTDSEMLQLDSKIVEIFSARKQQPNKKQEKKEAKENMINFKIRILDLLDIYVKKQSGRDEAFSLLLPLLSTIRTTNAPAVKDKAHSVITRFSKAFKRNSTVDDALSIAKRRELLKEVHAEASRNASHAYAKAASTASILIASSLYRADKETLADSVEIYKKSQLASALGISRIQNSFFHDWVDWIQSLATSSS